MSGTPDPSAHLARMELSKAFYQFASLLRSKAFAKAINTDLSLAYPSTAKETFAKLRSNFQYQLRYNLQTLPHLADASEHLARSIEVHGGFEIAKRDRTPRFRDVAEFYATYPFHTVPALISRWRAGFGPAIYLPFDSSRTECNEMFHETRLFLKAILTLRDGVTASAFTEMMAFANRRPDYFSKGYPADLLVWDAIAIEHGESARFFMHKEYCSTVSVRDNEKLALPDTSNHACFHHIQKTGHGKGLAA